MGRLLEGSANCDPDSGSTTTSGNELDKLGSSTFRCWPIEFGLQGVLSLDGMLSEWGRSDSDDT
jgi:hypothetical protein